MNRRQKKTATTNIEIPKTTNPTQLAFDDGATLLSLLALGDGKLPAVDIIQERILEVAHRSVQTGLCRQISVDKEGL